MSEINRTDSEKTPRAFRGKVRELSGKLRKNIVLRTCAWLSLPLFPLFCLFVIEYFNFYHYSKLKTLMLYFEKSPGFPFAVALMVNIFIILLLLCRRAWIAGGIIGFVSIACTVINYLKIALNGDNFYPKDLNMAGSTGELMSFVTTPMPKYFWMALAVLVLWIAALAFFKTEIPLRWYIRIPSAVLAAVLVISPLTPARAEKTLSSYGMTFVDTILQSSNYYANGFISAFTLNVLMINQAPEGYNEGNVKAILADYSATPATGEEQFDVIVVLSEAFFDVRTLPGLEFSENPLERYDEILLRDRCYSGNLYTTALGGGTVRPEFEMLTGLDTDYLLSGSSPWEFVTDNTETFVTNYRDAGYRTVALHPYDEKFYSRSYAYPYAGFEEFYGYSDLASMFKLSYKRGYTTDASTLEAMKSFLDGAEEPMFLFTITMQNHQAYNKLPESEVHLQVTHPTMEQNVLDSVVTYTQGLYDADKMLGELVDYIDSRERPTILVFFGDHLPTLGANLAAYNQSGVVNTSDGQSRQERMYLFSTPFIIYSNRDVEIPLFQSKQDLEISPYNVLNAVALATGFGRTPYMNFLLDFYDLMPYYNVRLMLDVTDEAQSYIDAIKLITYDRTSGKRYSE